MTRLVPAFLLLLMLHAPALAEPAPVVGREAPAWSGVTWLNRKEGPDPSRLRGRIAYLFLFETVATFEAHRTGLERVRAHFAPSRDVFVVAVHTPRAASDATDASRARLKALAGAFPLGQDAREGAPLRTAHGASGLAWDVLIDRGGIVRRCAATDTDIVPIVTRLWKTGGFASPLVGTRFGALGGMRWPGGEAVRFADHELTILRWWTNGCPHCTASVPALATTWRSHRDAGLHMVAVYHPKGRRLRDATVPTYLERLNYDGAYAFDDRWAKLRDLMRRAGFKRATSVSFAVDRRGIVRWAHPGPRVHPSRERRYRDVDRSYRELDAFVRAWLTKS